MLGLAFRSRSRSPGRAPSRARLAAALALSALLVPALPAHGMPAAADRVFRRLEEPAGLSHNSVYAILEDDRGFLWFGTADGLDRFDGYGFEVYRVSPGDAGSSRSNVVTSLLEDREHRIWVGTVAGLASVDLAERVLHSVPLEPVSGEIPPRVSALLEDLDGRVWVGTDRGLFTVEPGSTRASRRALPGDASSVADLRLDGTGDVWMLESGPRGARIRVDRRGAWTGPVALPEPWRGTRTFAIDSRNRLWGDGFAPLAVGAAGDLGPVPEGTAPAGAWALAEDVDGAMWVGTAAGLYRVTADGERRRYRLDPGRTGLIFEYVRALHRDAAGTIWVGTHGGIYRSDPHWKAFQHLDGRAGSEHGLTSAVVSGVAEDPDDVDRLWVGTLGGGVDVISLDGDTGTTVRNLSALPPLVWDVAFAPDGALWVAATSGLYRFDRRHGTASRIPMGDEDLLDLNTRDVAIGADGSVWAATVDGLYRVAPEASRGARMDVTPDATPAVESVAGGADGSVWFGTTEGSLGRLRPGSTSADSWTLRGADGSRLLNEGVWAIHVDATGTVWAGSGAGLTALQPESGAFRHFSTIDGLPGSVVYSIVEDEDGALWLGTNQGIVRFEPGDSPRIRVFTERDGIGSTEFNRHAALRGRDGRLYFGGVDGLTAFDPARIGDNPYVPPVAITSVTVSSPERTAELLPREGDEITLSYRDYSVSFEFTALSFTDPTANRYAFRMEGLDEGWIDSGTRRFARYTNLPPGRYTFLVRGANEDGVWNEDGARVALRVVPPFWNTTWFRLTLLGAIGGLLWSGHRLRVRHLLALERVRRELAADLHDDLGSDLSAMALTAEAIRDGRHDPEEVAVGLASLTSMARRLSNDVRDIVWLVDPGNDSLADLVFRMRGTAGRFLGSIEHSFDVRELEDAGRTSVESRRQVFLIYKESLNNAARHSGASKVDILVTGGSNLRLRVHDDGRGFREDQLDHRYGLEQMRRRATAIGGRVRVDSVPGGGTTVELTVPLT